VVYRWQPNRSTSTHETHGHFHRPPAFTIIALIAVTLIIHAIATSKPVSRSSRSEIYPTNYLEWLFGNDDFGGILRGDYGTSFRSDCRQNVV
jgi:hypothetical protein